MFGLKLGSGWAVFAIRDYALFFGSRFMSGVALQMNDVAIGWLVYARTHSALALGLVGLALFLPNVLLVLVVGQVADRFDRRRILIFCYTLVGLTSAALALVARDESQNIWPIFALVALIGTARAFANPASQALVPLLVPRELFSSAVAINSSAWQTATIAGPALGGFAYIVGPSFVFALTAALFGVTVLALSLIRIRLRPAPAVDVPPREDGTTRSPMAATWYTLTAGFRFIAGKPMVLGAISLDLFAVLLGGATALLPIYAADMLHTGPVGLGVLRAMPALGASAMALVLAQRPLNARVGQRMFAAVAVFGLATVVFGVSTSFWVSLPVLAIMGGADMVSVYVRQTLVQLETPDDMRGRVSAVNTLFIGASNQLGEFESGVLASFIGPVGSVVAGGIGTLLIVLLWMRLFPALRDRDKLVRS